MSIPPQDTSQISIDLFEISENLNYSQAIRHSCVRLQKARDALQNLQKTDTLNLTEAAWSDLLLAGSGIYAKLEQGSKVSGSAKGWFGRMKKERGDDPLLSYMHQARNSDEHGIEDITVRMKVGQATLTIREPFDPLKLAGLQIGITADPAGRVKVWSSNEDLISTTMYDKPEIRLTTIEDKRFNDSFNPPCEHLGIAIYDQSPKNVGKIYVNYLSNLILQAIKNGI